MFFSFKRVTDFVEREITARINSLGDDVVALIADARAKTEGFAEQAIDGLVADVESRIDELDSRIGDIDWTADEAKNTAEDADENARDAIDGLSEVKERIDNVDDKVNDVDARLGTLEVVVLRLAKGEISPEELGDILN